MLCQRCPIPVVSYAREVVHCSLIQGCSRFPYIYYLVTTDAACRIYMILLVWHVISWLTLTTFRSGVLRASVSFTNLHTAHLFLPHFHIPLFLSGLLTTLFVFLCTSISIKFLPRRYATIGSCWNTTLSVSEFCKLCALVCQILCKSPLYMSEPMAPYLAPVPYIKST